MVDSAAFSLTNRKKFLELSTQSEFDFVFLDLDIKEALFALLAVRMGFSCAIFAPKDFTSKLHPIVNVKDVDEKSIQALRNRIPHLILPDEYLSIEANKSRISGLLKGAIKRKDIAKYENILNIDETCNVFLEKEFKISSNRLLITLIKSAVKAGATILNHIHTDIITTSNNSLTVSDKTYVNNLQYSIDFKHLLNYETNQQVNNNKELHLKLDKKGLFLKRSLKFSVDNELVRLVRYQDHFLLVCENIVDNDVKLQLILDELNSILDWDNKYSLNDILSKEIVELAQTNTLKGELLDVEKFAKKYMDVSSANFIDRVKHLPVVDTNFESRIEIQELIEFADFRFDEAKQTGINPIAFKNLFYRYGSATDDLTEKAYDLHGELGPGAELWQTVQLWYLIHNEMICDSKDYLTRICPNGKGSDFDLIADFQMVDDYFSKMIL